VMQSLTNPDKQPWQCIASYYGCFSYSYPIPIIEDTMTQMYWLVCYHPFCQAMCVL